MIKGLRGLPDDIVVDGESVVLDEQGKPSFTLLANASVSATVYYYVFDLMILAGRDILREPFIARRELLLQQVL